MPGPRSVRSAIGRVGLCGVLGLGLLAGCSSDDDVAANRSTAASSTSSTSSDAVEAVGEGPVSIERTTVDVGDLRFDVRTAGPSDGELVVLLHGFPQTSAMWRHQLIALGEAGYFAVAPDQRGYSAGARPPDVSDYDVVALAGDVTGLADALDTDRFHLVGHDWGGAVAWTVGALSPDRLLSLTSISTPHLDALAATLADPASDQAERSSYTMTFSQAGSEEIFLRNDAAALRGLFAGNGMSPAEIEEQLAVLGEPEAMGAALNWYRANPFDTSADEQLGPVTVPTMFIWSDGDEFLGPDPAMLTGDHVSGPYRFEVLEGIDHWVPEKAADEVSRLLTDHLRDPGSTP